MLGVMDEDLVEPAGPPSGLTAEGTAPSYFALRMCPRAEAAEWWRFARRAPSGAPPAIRAILAGRTRVEVSAQEATAALEWARSVKGWDPDALAPVWIYPAAPVDA
jgi:hypothetical protein